MILVIDDDRRFKFDVETDEEVFYLRTVGSAACSLMSLWTKQYSSNRYGDDVSELWLDHDLGLNQSSGWLEDVSSIVDWLVVTAECNMPLKVNKIYVHSQNPVGAERVFKSLQGYYDVARVPLPDVWPIDED